MSDQDCNIQARRVTIESPQVFGVALPTGQFHVRVEETKEQTRSFIRGDSHPAVAHNVGCYSLHDLEVHLRGQEDGEVIVAVHIDKPGRDSKADCLKHSPRFPAKLLTHCGYTVTP